MFVYVFPKILKKYMLFSAYLNRVLKLEPKIKSNRKKSTFWHQYELFMTFSYFIYGVSKSIQKEKSMDENDSLFRYINYE